MKALLPEWGTRVFLFVLVLVGRPTVSEAADLVWTNTSGGSWGASANWNPNQVPGPADRALITTDGDYTVALNVNAEIAGLVVGGASGTQVLSNASRTLTLTGPGVIGVHGILQSAGGRDGPGELTVDGVLEWTGGNWTGPGRTGISATGTAVVSDRAKNLLQGHVLANAGHLTWSGASLGNQTDAVLRNEASGVIELNDEGLFVRVIFGGRGIENHGTLRKSEGVGRSQAGRVTNDGQVEVLSGTLDVSGISTNTGSFVIGAGAILEISEQPTFAEESQITGAGDCVFRGPDIVFRGHYAIEGRTVIGTSGAKVEFAPEARVETFGRSLEIQASTLVLNLPGELDIATLVLEGGTLDHGTAITVMGPMTWESGALKGPGRLRVLGDTAMTGTGLTLAEKDFENAGHMTWSSGKFSQSGGGRIRNLEGAVFDIPFDGSLTVAFGGEGLVNDGTLRKSGGTGAAQFGPLENHGRIEVLSGRLSCPGRYVQTAWGTLEVTLTGIGLAAGKPILEVTGSQAETRLDGALHLFWEDGVTLETGISPTLISVPNRRLEGRFFCVGGLNRFLEGRSYSLGYTADRVDVADPGLPPPSGPELHVTLRGDRVLACWPPEFTGFRLQSSPSLVPGEWIDLAGDGRSGPREVGGPGGDTVRFFRLVKTE